MKKEVSKAGKARNYNSKEKMANAKRLATACMRVQRMRAMESQRAMKEAFWRAKRLTREMQAHWKKYEREEKQQKKAKEKAAQEQRKHDIELLEAKRQQRKLNFLITQTELYAHFMAGKLGHQSKDTENTILSRLESDITEDPANIQVRLWGGKYSWLIIISFLLQGNIMLNLATLYELESSYATQKKIGMLGMVSQYSSDSFNISALKL